MALSDWEIGILITRWALYISVAAAIGGACSLLFTFKSRSLKQHCANYALLSAIIATVASISHFFVRVGAVVEEGFNGMFDTDMLDFMYDSPLGAALNLRLAGLVLLLALLILLAIKTRTQTNIERTGTFSALGILISSLLTAASFTQSGHAAEQGLLFQLILVLHITVAMAWMGILYPLWQCLSPRSLNSQSLNDGYSLEGAKIQLNQFTRFAVVWVPIAMVCGLYLSYQLTSWQQLFSGLGYYTLLLVKVGLVGAILLLAALHKLVLVPQVLVPPVLESQISMPKPSRPKSAVTLQRSIALEALVGASILAITTALSTLTGPH